MPKIDPHEHERYYNRWKDKGQPLLELTKQNADSIRAFLSDWEIGENIAPGTRNKGARSYGRLRNLKSKLHSFFFVMQQEIGINKPKDFILKKRELKAALKDWREGKLKNDKAKQIKKVGTYIKSFGVYWHWFQRTNDNHDIPDITEQIDKTDDKPKFIYITHEQLNKLMDEAKYEYKVFMAFCFYSGARPPTEVMNTRVRDFTNLDDKEKPLMLLIRKEISKTFERKNKMIPISDMLREYIDRKKLQPNDYLFTKTPQRMNQYLKNLAYRVLGIGKMEKRAYADKDYDMVTDGLSMYDLRHSGACYWVVRYKTEAALMYRFGWSKPDMVHYYTEFLGMKDTIQEDDLLIDISKTNLEKQLEHEKREREIMEERIKANEMLMTSLNKQMAELLANQHTEAEITAAINRKKPKL